jgi:hypothetical protein
MLSGSVRQISILLGRLPSEKNRKIIIFFDSVGSVIDY